MSSNVESMSTRRTFKYGGKVRLHRKMLRWPNVPQFSYAVPLSLIHDKCIRLPVFSYPSGNREAKSSVPFSNLPNVDYIMRMPKSMPVDLPNPQEPYSKAKKQTHGLKHICEQSQEFVVLISFHMNHIRVRFDAF